MMKKVRKKNAMFCMVLLVIMTFLSFFDIDYQIPSLSEDEGILVPEAVVGNLLENDSGILPDYLGTEETQTACNVAWICQNTAKRVATGRMDLAFGMALCMHTLCIAFAIFLFYSTRTVNRSLEFIICYIHDTDGQKD